MSVNLSPIGGAAWQFSDNNGNPLSGGKLYTYAAGTTTPLATYTTDVGDVAHTNPIILDSAGRVPGGQIWLTDGSVDYKFLLETSFSTLVGTFDNIPATLSGSAANIVYLPAGTGAVATTVQAKLRESVSVLDFGAVGDWNGVTGTDNTVAIQKAIDAVVDGGSVLIPAGYFLFSTVSKIGSVRLVGEGYTNNQASPVDPNYGSANWASTNNFSGSVLVSNAASGDAISFGSVSGISGRLWNFQMSNLMIVGPGTGTATAVHFVRGVGHYIENVLITNFTTGWNIDSCQDGTAVKLAAKSCKTGVVIGGTITSNQWVFLNPEIQVYTNFGMNILEASLVQIYGGLFQDTNAAAAIGINISPNATACTIKGVWFENILSDAAISISGGRTTVEGCYFANTPDNLKLRSDAHQSKILYNYFGSHPTSASSLSIDAGAENNYIFDSEPSTNGTFTNAGNRTIRIKTINGLVEQVIGSRKDTFAPNVSVYSNATQNFAAATQTKVVFGSKSFDTTNAFDAVTNQRFLPLVAGNYQINTNLNLYAAAGIGTGILTIYKSGSPFKRLNMYSGGSATDAILAGSALIAMNGVTDYLEVFIFVTGTSPSIQQAAGLFSTFDAAFINGA